MLLHFGSLHPFEQALAVVLAFGPFVVLGLVIAVRRRQDAEQDGADDEGRARRADDPRLSR